jgi:hypothetical protein
MPGGTVDPSELGRALQALRRNRKGKPKVLLPCPHCRMMLGAREQRQHWCRGKEKAREQGP